MILFGVDQATELACPVDAPSFHPVSSEKAVLIFCKKKKTVGLGESICESTCSSFIYTKETVTEKKTCRRRGILYQQKYQEEANTRGFHVHRCWMEMQLLLPLQEKVTNENYFCN
jgi:hypothetical protein